MQPSKIQLSVIIVEYNCLEDLRVCVSSILKHMAGMGYEVIVYSNSNHEYSTQEKLKKEFPDIVWGFNKINLGFAKSNNMGIKISKGEYILLLNPDACLTDGNISQLMRYMDNNPDVGIVGPRIIDYAGNVQDSCRDFMTPYVFIARVAKRFIYKKRKEMLGHPKDYANIQNVDWVSGACMLIRRNGIEKVGLMDERYFIYIEDMDWCKRFWDNGFKVIYWPKMTIQHKGKRISSEAISKRHFNKYAWLHFINYLKFFCKFFPKSLWLKRRI